MPYWEEEDDDVDAGEAWKPEKCDICHGEIPKGTGVHVLLDNGKTNLPLETRCANEIITICGYCQSEQCVKMERDFDHQEIGLDWARKLLKRL